MALHEECGIFGVYGHPQAATLCYYGLHSLQHRGQEAAGILVREGREFYLHKGQGLVSEVFDEALLKRMNGDVAMGHVRYATAGDGGLANVQPILFRTLKGSLGICHNGNLINWRILKAELEEMGSIFQSSSDTEIIGHLIKRESGRMIDRIKATLRQLDGGFALLIVHEEAMYACRDRYGLRPLVIGRLKDGSYVFASETCALDIVGADFVREVAPGEIVRVKGQQLLSCFYTDDIPEATLCAMEYIYFSRPDSDLKNINMHAARKRAGRELFKESPTAADVVIGVPDSSLSAAIGYAEAARIPYEMGLIKNKYVGRTFIQPTQELREQGVRMKLSAIKSIVKDQRVILIDDSIVRGTTAKRIIARLKEAGAREVHVKIASPMFRFPCFYGVDFATFDELLANHMDLETMRDYLGADSLYFLSLEGLKAAIGHEQLCLACFHGHYPTALYDAFQDESQTNK